VPKIVVKKKHFKIEGAEEFVWNQDRSGILHLFQHKKSNSNWNFKLKKI